jgi:transitional endoplasmic reticulum ATPase
MEINYKGILPKNFSINEKYKVLLFIKQGDNAETYRVKGNDGKLYFLKLFNYSKLHHSSFDADNNLLEIEITKILKNDNIVKYNCNGELFINNKRYGYLILDFIAGETLSEKIKRAPLTSLYDLKQIIIGVLNGLNYLHNLPSPIIHNEITPQNIMPDLSADNPQAKIIDFGYARLFHSSTRAFNKEGLDLNYVASECFHNIFSPQSDIFSVGVLMYQLLFGIAPWTNEISKYRTSRGNVEELIIEERKKPLAFPNIENKIADFDESILKVLKKALQNDPENRFQSANEFIQALNGEIEIENVDTVQKVKSGDKDDKKIKTQKAKGKGFDAIAGMKELKAQLQLDVIDALNNPEEYAKFGLTIPNGMLLYGPPGCGKTFFAKHFAEEVGSNFMHVNPGTLKSRYINATEENISKMFQDAEKNAHTIIFIEEISGLFPSRDSDAHEMSKNAVEAMLAEMDRTGEKGIFVLCATNYPDKIDAALLRAGRLDKKIYLPPPDFEARKAMFEMYLKPRPIDFGIDYDKLADLTENYVSSDIKDSIIDIASREALKAKSRITMKILEEVIKKTKPSVTLQELKKHEQIKAKMNGENIEQKNDRPRIGFNTNRK